MQVIIKGARLTRLWIPYLSNAKSLIANRMSLFSNKETNPCKENRLMALMDDYAGNPIGMWHQLYHARVFYASEDESIEFVKNWCRMRIYICAIEGLTETQRDAICTEYAWNPSISKTELIDLCHQNVKLTDDEVQQICDRINDTYPMEFIHTLLLDTLCGCGASLNGLNVNHVEEFVQTAEELGIDNATARDIYSLYSLEVQLKQKYNAFAHPNY
eukprot:69698_1